MRIIPAIAAALLAVPGLAAGEDLDLTMFGHEVKIAKDGDDSVLKVDQREMVRNSIILIDEIDLVGTVPAVVGTSSEGGNACEGSRFVLSFPPGGTPRLDGPLDGCAGVNVENQGGRLLLSERPIPGRPGDRWNWTPDEGFKQIDSVGFKPDDGKGWDALRERKASHPSELFSNAEVAKQIYALLGNDKAQFEQSITGVGSGSFDGDMFVGSACTPHMCTDEEAILVADIANRSVYLAWKPMNGKIVVRPPVKEWPQKARTALKDWAAKWK
jgi:hypothetical protein